MNEHIFPAGLPIKLPNQFAHRRVGCLPGHWVHPGQPPRPGPSRRLWLRLPVLPFCAETLVRTTEQNGALWHLFDARDVPRFYASEKYTCFYWHTQTGPEEHLLADSLDALERRLQPHHFVRVQRGELINLRFLRRIWLRPRRKCASKAAAVYLELTDGQRARISRRRLPAVRQLLQQLQPGLRLPRELGVRPLPL